MIAFVMLIVACFAAPAFAQNDNDDAQVVMMPVFEINEQQFDSWIFQNAQNAKGARERLEKHLALQIDFVEKACRLNHTQRKKLNLAGRGDIKTFFEQVDVVRQKFLLVRKDQNKFNELWQDIQPLQMTFQAGLFGDDSLFAKTLRNVLDSQQREAYGRIDGERRAFQYRARVELTVAMIENTLPLRDEQRQKLIETILENSQPPRRASQQDYYVVLWGLSKIPESKLRPLFDADEWKLFSRQIEQGRAMEQWLRASKLIEEPSSDDGE